MRSAILAAVVTVVLAACSATTEVGGDARSAAAAAPSVAAATPTSLSQTVRIDIDRWEGGDPDDLTRRYPPEAMRWNMRYDLDVERRYAFVALEGQAEPGDAGCHEILFVDGRGYSRNTFDSAGPFDFAEDPEAVQPEIFEAESAARLATSIDTLFAAAGLTLPPPGIDERGLTYRAEISSDATMRLLEQLPDLGGIDSVYDTAALHALATPDGVLLELDVTAEYEGTVDLGDGETRHERETLVLSLTNTALDAATTVSPDMSLLDTGWCHAPSTTVIGEWAFVGFLAGGTAAGAEFFESVDGSVLEIGDDGTLEGTIGCRRFSGSASVEYSGFDAIEVAFDDSACTTGPDEHQELLEQVLTGPTSVGYDAGRGLMVVMSSADESDPQNFGAIYAPRTGEAPAPSGDLAQVLVATTPIAEGTPLSEILAAPNDHLMATHVDAATLEPDAITAVGELLASSSDAVFVRDVAEGEQIVASALG